MSRESEKSWIATLDPALEFLRFVESQPRQSHASLMSRILRKSRELCRAEAGTIFTVQRRGGRACLVPQSVQNDAVKVRRSEFIVPIGPGTIAGYVADSAKTVLLDDVYAIPRGRPYRFDPGHERKGYRTRSMLAFPLKNYRDKVIGVVQLINARRPGRKQPVPFERSVERLVMAMSPIIGQNIERSRMLDQIRNKNRQLRERNLYIAHLQEQTEEAFQLSIQLLSRAAEIHDEDTGNHITRVNEYSYRLARLAGMSEQWCEVIRYSAQLHDVGKMSVDAAVLKKRGRLNAEERLEMDRHTTYGHKILSGAPRLEMAAEVALNHHEQWNGGGYPNGRKGQEIPLSARIVQIADVYDALRSERAYKPAFSHEKTVKIMTFGDDRLSPAKCFDPALLALFKRNHRHFNRIWKRLQD